MEVEEHVIVGGHPLTNTNGETLNVTPHCKKFSLASKIMRYLQWLHNPPYKPLKISHNIQYGTKLFKI